MKMNSREHELNMIATDLTLKVYEGLPVKLSNQEFAEVLLLISQNLVSRARIVIMRIND